MECFRTLPPGLLLFTALQSAAIAADKSAGERIFEARCAACHVPAGSATGTLGPGLVGIVGRKAGAGKSGVHSRAPSA